MLINLEPFGRLGNQLFLAAHLVAFSNRFRVPVLNLAFRDSAGLFPWLDDNAGFAYPWQTTGPRDELKGLIRRHRQRSRWPWSHRWSHWGDFDWDFDRVPPDALLRPLLRHEDVYFRSWLFRGFESLAMYRDEVLKIFSPRTVVLNQIEEATRSWRTTPSPLIVGVHIRWEDYRGTEHFLTTSQYRLAIERMIHLLEKTSLCFILFSNEEVPLNEFSSLPVLLSPGTSPEFDLYAMARCDYLLAPPSTFSGWASFYGEVPLLRLRAGWDDWTLSDFEVIKG